MLQGDVSHDAWLRHSSPMAAPEPAALEPAAAAAAAAVVLAACAHAAARGKPASPSEGLQEHWRAAGASGCAGRNPLQQLCSAIAVCCIFHCHAWDQSEQPLLGLKIAMPFMPVTFANLVAAKR